MMLIGTSGWQYRDWRGPFYPARLPQRLLAGALRELFGTVEVNNAFYRLPERATFEAWRERTPDGLRRRGEGEPVPDPRQAAAGPGGAGRAAHGPGPAGWARLGPVLLQLPPTMRVDVDALDATLAAFPRGRVAVEPRHDSWWVDEVRQVLRDRGAALCWADRGGRPVTPLWRPLTGGTCGCTRDGRSRGRGYGRTALDTWAGRLAAVLESYVYCNNDPGCAAVRDALTLARLARRRGLTVGRAGPP